MGTGRDFSLTRILIFLVTICNFTLYFTKVEIVSCKLLASHLLRWPLQSKGWKQRSATRQCTFSANAESKCQETKYVRNYAQDCALIRYIWYTEEKYARKIKGK